MTRAGGCSSGLFPKIRRPARLPRSPFPGRRVRGQGRRRRRAHPAREGTFCVCFALPAKQVGAAISGATFRFPQKIPGARAPDAGFAFSERACTRRPLCLFRALFRRAEAHRKEAAPGLPSRDGKVALCVCRALPQVFVFFVRRFARRRSSARTCAFVRGAGAEGRFSESAASCGVCAFSRAAGGPAYSKPRLRR